MRSYRGGTDQDTGAGATGGAPGKRTLTGGLVVQRKVATGAVAAPPPELASRPAAEPTDDPFGMHLIGEENGDDVDEDDAEAEDVMATAAEGVAGGGESLPFLDQIQRSFGHHDVSGARGHTGAAASEAAGALGASAYAFGEDVAFAGTPDLHTAADEAAHVVQQAAGVKLKTKLGEPGDAYEQNADAVADAVVRGDPAAPLLDQLSGGGHEVQLKRKRRKKKRTGPLAVIVRPNPIHLQVDKPTRVLFDTNRRPPKGATWAFTNSEPDAVSVTQPVKAEKSEPAEVAVTMTGHATGDARIGATLLPKDAPAVITEVPVTVTTKKFGSAYETIAKAWGKEAGESLTEQLIVWGSMWDPDVIRSYRLDISIATGEQDEYTQLEAIRTLRHNVGELLTAKVRQNPTNVLESLTAFRRDARHERMMRFDGFPAYDQQLDDAVSEGIKRRIKDEVSPILKKAKNVRGALLQPLTNSLTADALAPYRQVDESLAELVRQGFYSAVKELFAESGERAIAICFIHAMTDVMVGHFENAELRNEVPEVANQLATMAQTDDRVDVRDNQAINLASDTALHEKTNLMDRDLHRNSVEIKYTKLYLGIRQAFQRVGDHWIKARTQGLRDDIGTVETWQTWIGRGMNVAWAVAPAINPAAVGVAAGIEVAGIIIDCFLAAEIAAAQKDLAQREAAMRAELDRRLGATTQQLTDQAAADFAAIARDDAAVSTLSSSAFQSLTDIEQLYGDALVAELDAMPRD